MVYVGSVGSICDIRLCAIPSTLVGHLFQGLRPNIKIPLISSSYNSTRSIPIEKTYSINTYLSRIDLESYNQDIYGKADKFSQSYSVAKKADFDVPSR